MFLDLSPVSSLYFLFSLGFQIKEDLQIAMKRNYQPKCVLNAILASIKALVTQGRQARFFSTLIYFMCSFLGLFLLAFLLICDFKKYIKFAFK